MRPAPWQPWVPSIGINVYQFCFVGVIKNDPLRCEVLQLLFPLRQTDLKARNPINQGGREIVLITPPLGTTLLHKFTGVTLGVLRPFGI